MPEQKTGVSRLRVALDTTFAGVNPTGVGLYSARLATELRNQSTAYGLDLKCYGPACKPPGSRSGLLGTFQEWPTYTHGLLPARLLAFRPRIVHATSHIGPLWGSGRLIVTVHDLIFMRFPEDYQRGWLALTRALLPRVLRRATAIIADSHATKDEIEHFFGIRPAKIVVIYPGIDSEIERAYTTKLTVTNWTGAPYMLCLGPWVQRKNLPVVAKAFSLLAPRLPEVQLVITGEKPRGMKGHTGEELLSHVSDEYHNRVHLVGYVSQAEKQALIANASVLCYPSRLEGFGLPPLEAMALGTPVVAAASPAVVEVTGGAALTVDPDDPAKWADAIEQLLSVPERPERLRSAGLRRSALFTWERCASQTADLYRRVASRYL
jgi:glycosyltransferase involved in cell wall biosynthesis